LLAMIVLLFPAQSLKNSLCVSRSAAVGRFADAQRLARPNKWLADAADQSAQISVRQ